jgi:hemolysin activation/secretion protein
VSAQLGSPTWKWGEQLALSGFAFADYGLVGTLQPLPGEDSSADLASLGIGLKVAAFENVAGEMAWAYPLVDGDRTVAGDSRIHFVLRSSW